MVFFTSKIEVDNSISLGEHVKAGNDGTSHENGGDNDLPEEFGIDCFPAVNEPDGDERNGNTGGGNDEGEVDGISSVDHRFGGSRDDKSSAGGFSKRSEQVSSHTSNITDVVTDVISNGTRVQWGVFLKSKSNFSSKIGTNISGFGVNTTTDTTEESDGGATETISRDVFEENANLSGSNTSISGVHNDGSVDHDENLEEEKGNTNKAETEDLTSDKSNVESSSDVLGSLCSNLGVGVSCYNHADVSTKHGSSSSDEESHGGHREGDFVSGLIFHPGLVNGTGENDREHSAENSELGVFFLEESFSAVFDMVLNNGHLVYNFFTALGNEHKFQGFLLIGILFLVHFCL
jgi:hypothetical protein